MALFSGLFDRILALLGPVIAPIRAVYNLVVHTKDTVKGLIDSFTTSAEHLASITAKLRDFSLAPNFRTRVVNVPIAAKHAQDFIDAIKEIIQTVKDLWAQIKEVSGQSDAEESDATEVDADLATLEESATQLLPKLGKVVGKVGGYLTIVLMFITIFQKQFDLINKTLADIDEIISDLDNLDGIFLQQKNSRRTIETPAGPIRIRVGKLHSSATV